jgi:hypothetical protein
MTAVGRLEGADPTDLDGLHEALKLAVQKESWLP